MTGIKPRDAGIPTDYEDGHRAARLLDPGLADRYIAHTTRGDPAADALVEELAPLPAGRCAATSKPQ